MFSWGLSEVLLPLFLSTPSASTEDAREADNAPRAIASYEISATLDEKEHVIEGQEHISFLNASRRALPGLYFHLYLNAFENNDTLFLRTGKNRSGAKLGRPGSISVSSLTSRQFLGVDLWDGAEKHSPGDPKDRTDIYVPLPEPLPPGETLDLEVHFTSQLPEVIERTGYVGQFHLVAQWYPKLAKLEQDGSFAHFRFHPAAEFYANFGDYVVTLDLPLGYETGSTGELLKLSGARPGRTLYRATAEGVHDFAWFAGKSLRAEERSIGPVKVRVLLPAHAQTVREKTWETLERALPWLGKNYGPYPYPTLTVVHPPKHAMRAGGMEYPSFITTGGSELIQRLGVRGVELIVVHELAHQWFQSALASNEVKHPFLDEGLTSFAEWRYLDETYGLSSVANLPFFPVSRLPPLRMVQGKPASRQAISTAAPDFRSFSGLASAIYGRTPLCLETLRRVYKREKFDAALKDYAQTYRFRHPKPSDFYAVLAKHLGPDGKKAARVMIEEKGWIDLSLKRTDTKDMEGSLETTVFGTRRGNLSLPFTLKVQFSDGTLLSRTLTSAGPAFQVKFRHQTPLAYAEVDPEREIIIDEDFVNNRVRPKERRSPFSFGSFIASAALLLLGLLSP